MSEEEKKEEATSNETAEGSEEKSGAASLELGRGGIVGVKAGMTQVYDDDGQAMAVTVIDLQPAIITQVKSKEKDGYNAVQVGMLDKKSKRTKKTEVGHAKKSGGKVYQNHQEFRLPENADMSQYSPGQVLSPGFLKEGDRVDLTSVSKGKGFQGVIKRHHFAGAPASHGVSIVHRLGGSIGMCQFPGKVLKGKKMAGHMGHKKVTVQNVKVVGVRPEDQVLLVNGSVPGPKSGIVTIRKAIKTLGVV